MQRVGRDWLGRTYAMLRRSNGLRHWPLVPLRMGEGGDLPSDDSPKVDDRGGGGRQTGLAIAERLSIAWINGLLTSRLGHHVNVCHPSWMTNLGTAERGTAPAHRSPHDETS